MQNEEKRRITQLINSIIQSAKTVNYQIDTVGQGYRIVLEVQPYVKDSSGDTVQSEEH